MGKNSPFLLFFDFSSQSLKLSMSTFKAMAIAMSDRMFTFHESYRQRFKDNKELLRLGYKDSIHNIPDFDSHVGFTTGKTDRLVL